MVDVSADSTTIDVLHGSVNASNSKGSVSLALGDRAVTRLNEAPTKSILVRPADSVQWMINFPFVLVEGDLLASPDPGCGDACAQAIKAILADVSKGDTLLTALDKHDQPLWHGSRIGAQGRGRLARRKSFRRPCCAAQGACWS